MANNTPMSFVSTRKYEPKEPPLIFDVEEMERLCNAPAYEMPKGLSREEKRAWVRKLAGLKSA